MAYFLNVGYTELMKIVAITLYNRPRQTKQLFNYLVSCEGIQEYSIYINIDGFTSDPNVQRVLNIVEQFKLEHPGLPVQCFYNHAQLGIDCVKKFLLDRCYAESEFVIFMEDDTWPHRQLLRYFEQQYFIHKDNPDFVSITGYQYSTKEEYNNFIASGEDGKNALRSSLLSLDLFLKFESFKPWIWLMPPTVYYEFFGHDWEKYLAEWPTEYNSRHDHYILQCMQKRPGSYSVQPLISYTLLLDAAEGATHTPSQQWFEENELTWFHRGSLD